MLRLSSRQASISPTPVINIAAPTNERSRRRQSRSEEGLQLPLKPGMLRLAWLLIISAHTLCAMFLLIFAATYYYLTDPIMGYYVHLWAPEKGNEHYGLYALVFAAMYFLHLSRILTLIYCSICECQLAFKRTRRHKKATSPRRQSQRTTRGVMAECRHHTKTLLRPARRVWASLFALNGLFGVESEHFLTVFVLRELLELSTQTYQAYQFSRFLPRVWLNTLLVALLLANCWSTLAVQLFLGSKPALERVVALSADAAICIAISVVVPCLLVAPYADAMDTANSSFKDPDQLYDPVFVTRLVLEFRLTFASGLTDFAAKIFPHFALYMSLVTIGSLLTRSSTLSASVGVSEAPRRWVGDSSVISESVRSSPQNSGKLPKQDAKACRLAKVASWRLQRSKQGANAHKVVKTILGLWGALIMVLHLHAAIESHLTSIQDCRAFTRPWFASSSSCISLVISCHTRGIESPDDAMFASIDEKALATLTFAHCPSLHMPPVIQRFSNLMVLHIYNSTVVEWGSNSGSITAAAHPRLFFTAIARTKFPLGFPDGLLEPLPASLLSIMFCVTDLKSIPDDLPSRWHSMAVVAFEYGELTEIPASLLSLQVYTLSLKGNRIETIPQLSEMPPSLTIPELSLTENPLKELPETLGSSTSFIIRLDLQETNLTSLPAWAGTQVLKKNYMHGTPYCSQVPAELQPSNVHCGPRSVVDLNLDFPLAYIDEIYAIR
ncbi:hypothetical protein V7S43_015585 [Phytophthora oleae]|uniref:Uncharacterized protein n=1 Tax=Phytophthora oleae TaxID=2107226 RepID=A0ABD3F2E7_9STRA